MGSFVFSPYSDEYALQTNSKCAWEAHFAHQFRPLFAQDANQRVLWFCNQYIPLIPSHSLWHLLCKREVMGWEWDAWAYLVGLLVGICWLVFVSWCLLVTVCWLVFVGYCLQSMGMQTVMVAIGIFVADLLCRFAPMGVSGRGGRSGRRLQFVCILGVLGPAF